METDVAVVGSGFGGAVMACRLAEQGLSVTVLERGIRWSPENFPRTPADKWLFDPDHPEKQHGWFDLRFFDDMVVAQGAGVGGGSLVYANVSVEAPPHIFHTGWPKEITYQELKPFYQQVGEMLEVQPLPENQLTERFKLLREAADQSGSLNRFGKLPLAVQFDPDWHYQLDDQFNHKYSKPFTNPHGKQQGTCIHLGNCDIGCDVNARNTLDLNYLAMAESKGASILPLHHVDRITPEDDGYRLDYRQFFEESDEIIPGFLQAKKVVLSAGSLGSTELLLRAQYQHRTLPSISAKLGQRWSSNGDFLTPAFYEKRQVDPTIGPTITAAIDYLDGNIENQEFFIEDGGFPDLVNNYLLDKGKLKLRHLPFKQQRLLRKFRKTREQNGPLSNMMPWFAQGIDAANGRLYLGRKFFAPWQRILKLNWDIKKSRALIEAIVHTHQQLSRVTNADRVIVPPTWKLLKNLITPHPLGGCIMGDDADKGVVNQFGEVFNYPGLYVIDGAMIPEAIGRNPSRTIAALAERCATHFKI